MSTTIFPIREISTYNGRNWTIKARVTSKSQMRTFTNDRGNGKVFSVDLLDRDGGEIKASFFNGGCDKFYNDVEVGKIYTMSKGNIKVANKRFSTSKHNYEINFDQDAVIVPSPDDASIDSVKYSFVKVRDILTKHIPCTVDLVGVVRDVRPMGKVQAKNGGEELTRRTIVLVDSSECAIELTLWQDACTKWDESILNSKPIVAVKGVSIREYNGARMASTLQQSLLELVTEASPIAQSDGGKEILNWWKNGSHPNISDVLNISSTGGAVGGADNGGASMNTPDGRNPHQITSIADMREECKRGFFGDKGIFFDIVGKLSFVSTKTKDADLPIYYSACPGCNRKLSDDGASKCFACDKTVSNPKLKYLLRAQFIDHSEQCFLSVFDSQAVTIVRKSVEDLLAAASNNSNVADELKKSYFEKDFHMRVKAVDSQYKGESRPKVTVISAEPVDYLSMGKKMLKKIIGKIGIEKIDTIMEENACTDDQPPENKKMRYEQMEELPAPVIESKE